MSDTTNSNMSKVTLTCSASWIEGSCNRTRESHPTNFKVGRKTNKPLCQAHYLQAKKTTFKGRYHGVSESGKQGIKYNTRDPTKTHSCNYCNKGYNSAQSLWAHLNLKSEKGPSACNFKHLNFKSEKRGHSPCIFNLQNLSCNPTTQTSVLCSLPIS